MFVTWHTFSCRLEGVTQRKHRCENCLAKYAYMMQRQVQSHGSALYGIRAQEAQAKTDQRAREELEAILASDFDLVPCPNCGWYQSAMVNRAHYQRYWWITRARAIALSVAIYCVISVFTFLFQPRANRDESELPIVFAILSGALLLAGGFHWLNAARRNKYDLNGTPVPERIETALLKGATILVTACRSDSVPKDAASLKAGNR